MVPGASLILGILVIDLYLLNIKYINLYPQIYPQQKNKPIDLNLGSLYRATMRLLIMVVPGPLRLPRLIWEES